MSTTGVTADWEFGAGAGAAGGVGTVAGAVAVWFTVVRVVTGRLGAGAGLAAAVWVVRVTVRALAVVALAGFDTGAASVVVVLVSVVAVGAASVTGGVATGGVCATGSVGVDVVGTSWASRGVEESAMAAAIAGRTLVRALSMRLVVIMMEKTTHAPSSSTIIGKLKPAVDD
jgi:hypothetical protein